MTDRFSKLSNETARMGETNDCSVKAVAVVTGLSYAEAHALCRQFGRRNRKGMFPIQYHAAIKSLGFTIEKLIAGNANGSTSHRLMKCKTIVTLGRNLPKRGVFLVRVRGHVLAARAGKIHDWTEGRRHRIEAIYRVSRPADAGPLPQVTPTPAPESVPNVPRPRRTRRTRRPRSIHRERAVINALFHVRPSL